MNAATGGGPPEQAAWLTLVLGALAPAESTDLDIYPADFAPIERANAGTVFRRRTAITPPAGSLVHLGIAPLTRRELNRSPVGGFLVFIISMKASKR